MCERETVCVICVCVFGECVGGGGGCQPNYCQCFCVWENSCMSLSNLLKTMHCLFTFFVQILFFFFHLSCFTIELLISPASAQCVLVRQKKKNDINVKMVSLLLLSRSSCYVTVGCVAAALLLSGHSES